MEFDTAKGPTGWSAANQHEQDLRKHVLSEALRTWAGAPAANEVVEAAEVYLKFIKGDPT